MSPVMFHVDGKDGREPNSPVVRATELNANTAGITQGQVRIQQQLKKK
jgi:hypothetical protein